MGRAQTATKLIEMWMHESGFLALHWHALVEQKPTRVMSLSYAKRRDS